MNHTDGPEQMEADISKFHPDVNQPRRFFDKQKMEDLRKDIEKNGLDRAIDVCYPLDGRRTKFLIIDGHRRYYAINDIKAFGSVRCNLFPYTTQREIDRHRASAHSHQDDWTPSDRAKFYMDYKVKYSLSLRQLADEIHQPKSTVDDWIRPARHDDVLQALEKGEVTQSQARLLSQIDSVEERENALSDAIGKTLKETKQLSEIRTLETPKEELPETPEDERTLIIRTAPDDAQERLLDATKDMDLHDTERVVKQVIMGVTVPEAVRAVELHTKAPQGTEEDALTVDDGTEDSPLEQSVNGNGKPLTSVPETPEILERAFEIGGEKGTEDFDSGSRASDVEVSTQSSLPEGGIDVGETGETVSTPPVVEDVEPPLETKPTEPKIIKFVNRMLNLGVAVDSHMRHKELKALADSDYHKLLKDYEEASFSIDGFRDFLQGRENNGSVQFNRAKRLHNAIREFDAHSISSIKEATDLRSIKIQTKKKLTEDVNIFDNIINAKKPASQEGV